MGYTRTSFRPGCPPGPGRPKGSKNKQQAFRQAMLDATSQEDLAAVIRSVMWAATLRKDRHGKVIPPDVTAARLYLETVVGKPIQKLDVEVTDLELTPEEAEHLRYCAVTAAQHWYKKKMLAEGHNRPALPGPQSN